MSRTALVAGGNSSCVFATLGLAQQVAFESPRGIATPLAVALIYSNPEIAASIHGKLTEGLRRVSAVLPADAVAGSFSSCRPAIPGEAERMPPPPHQIATDDEVLAALRTIQQEIAVGGSDLSITETRARIAAGLAALIHRLEEGVRS